jgi:hypothetical protein
VNTKGLSQNKNSGYNYMPKSGTKKATLQKKFYVYFHRDRSGKIFYVGKGTGRRAWSRERHDLWKKYVEEILHGEYTVEIFRDGLSEREAEELEWDLINKYGEQLVNWMNPSTGIDYEVIALYHKLREENRRFVDETRLLEKIDPEKAIIRYREALVRMREYQAMTLMHGSLLAELRAEEPKLGDWNIIDRLTLCLKRSKRFREAIDEIERYFADFPGDLNTKAGERLKKRMEALRRQLESTKGQCSGNGDFPS